MTQENRSTSNFYPSSQEIGEGSRTFELRSSPWWEVQQEGELLYESA